MRNICILWFVALAMSGLGAPAPAVNGPRVTAAEFFTALDLERAELSAVKAALQRQDLGAARHALAEYLRHRPKPGWEFNPLAIKDNPKFRSSTAEKALTHKFNSIGIEWQFGEQIDWAFNPTTQPDSRWPRNHEWTWQLSRHAAWLELSRAFYHTGDEKYAREFVAELKSWVRDCPVPMEKAANRPTSRWRTIEAGIRTGSVWPEMYHRLLAAKAFDDDALILLLTSILEHGRYLTKFHTSGNWLTMEANGLYHCGALFPEFKEAAQWRQTALDRLYHELDVQVYPDGAQVELAPGYHGVTVQNFLGPVSLVPFTGFTVPKDYLGKMERMFDYFLYSMQPTRQTAPLNDSGAGDVVRWLEKGSQLFPQRDDFKWVATEGKAGQAPGHTSHLFPYAGQFVMRSGWEREAVWLCMDGGPFGYGHQHEDKLSVILTAYGRPLLVEGGVYTYDASDWRRYVLSSRAHNVVLVDGQDQNRRKEPKETYVVKQPLPHVWESNDTFDHAVAVYEEGYGASAARVARQVRHVYFFKPDLFVVLDELESRDGKAHEYQSLFHIDANEAVVDGLKVSTGEKGPNLTIIGVGVDTVQIVKGQKEPVVQGWLPDRGGYGAIKPIPTAIYRKTGSGKVVSAYVLCPIRQGATGTVTGAQLTGNELRLTLANGQEKVLKLAGKLIGN
ncbi:MAG: alginate lyase family protein [Verrucomicrobiota bacterium]